MESEDREDDEAAARFIRFDTDSKSTFWFFCSKFFKGVCWKLTDFYSTVDGVFCSMNWPASGLACLSAESVGLFYSGLNAEQDSLEVSWADSIFKRGKLCKICLSFACWSWLLDYYILLVELLLIKDYGTWHWPPTSWGGVYFLTEGGVVNS